MKIKFSRIAFYFVLIFNLFLLTGIFKAKHHQKVSASMNERSEMTINVQNKKTYKTDHLNQFIINSSLIIGQKIKFIVSNPNCNLNVKKSNDSYQATITVPNEQSTSVIIYSSGKELTNSDPVQITLTNLKKTASGT